MNKLPFGTDGVRAKAGDELTPEFVRALGAAAASVLGSDAFAVGRDTRESGPMFEQALADGLASVGAETLSLGVVPTPAVAWVSMTEQRPAAMISASHNPWTDNGIKLFAPGGKKLTDALQDQISAVLSAAIDHPSPNEPAPLVKRIDALGGYQASIAASIDGRSLQGRYVVDMANGSNSELAERVLRALGLDVIALCDSPTGRNINDGCGSNHPEMLQAAVLEHDADGGIAFDGDADRVVAVDHNGDLVDGDQIIGICAIDKHQRGTLTHDTVVVTVMTNLGFRLGMERQGITVVDTNVGDRYVIEALDAGGFNLGGEQSGHVIFGDVATTGDGLLTAVQLLDVVTRRSSSLAELAAETMTRLPQTLIYVRVSEMPDDLSEQMASAVAEAESELGETGRVLLRKSGTEPLVRVMVEAADAATAERIAGSLAETAQDLF